MYASLIDLLQARADGLPHRTAFIFLAEGETETERLTFAELDRRARAIGQGLIERGLGGERILLLHPPGLDFVAAYFGCLYAGSVAVTGYPPRQNHHTDRLRAIVIDACPAAALTSAGTLPRLHAAAAAIPEMSGVVCLSTAEAEGDPAAWRSPGVRPEDLAFLQYTSGSTATPKGVMVSHGNLLHNCGMMADLWRLTSESVMVSWLPTFHDLGLIFGMLSPVWAGCSAVHMPPVGFLKKPLRWLRAISRYRGTHSASPNFGYDLCVRRISPEQRADLDLSSWEMAMNGAEPIRLSTVQAFYETFREQGLRWTTQRPGYGLAEGTLMVSGSGTGEELQWLMLDDAALQKDRAVLSSSPGSRPLVGCGRPAASWEVAIVHPETLKPCGPYEVGEVWVAGPSVAHGYWQRPEETERIFGGRLATGEGPYLRTGDLGFLHEGELYITGRLKDLIIIRGSNHYPQDIEATVERAHPSLRPGSTAAFAVDEDGEERLVVVVELERPEKHEIPEVIRAVRQAVAEEHELQVHGVVLAKKGAVPKTSSGKIQRRGCRAALQDGTLPVVARSFEPVVSAEPPPAPAAESASASPGGSEVRAWLLGRVAERLRVPPGNLDAREPLARYGLDSAAAVELAGQVEEWLERPQPQTLFYDHPTIEALARHLAGEEEARRSGGEPAAARPGEPVAIIGIGCRFPGAAGPEAFWRLLAMGVDAVTERAPGVRAGSGRPGGFLEGVDLFDAAFFGISPREATQMDPQQRLLLEVAWEALEDAGRDPRSLAGTRTGVFIGISSADYGYLQFASPERAEAASGPGGALSVAANRLSYFFDWHGPSLAVDTACSASLVAVDLACRALAAGECSLALAGGVNVALMEGTTRAFERAGLIAAGGRCRAFDQAADGYVRSEGAGVVVLKPLSRAEEDGDPVYAVIRGTAVNQDGRTNGLVAPSRQAQEEVLREAWRRAGVPPGRAQYVEAHGSGTALGDAIEAAALGSVLAEGRAPDTPCLVGSVKTNLGHLESAAGIAGLIKTALSLAHRQVPPSLHFRQPSTKIPFAALPLRVNTELRPLPGGDGPALAGVSSFGMGGTNAHVVLEEAPAAPARSAGPGREWQVLVWSARSESALEEATERLARHLAEHPEEDLADLAFTLQTGRSVFPWRRALVCRSREDAAAALASRDPRRLLTLQRRDEPRPLAFVFPGLADHYPGMGRDLYRAEPVFRAELDRCCEILRPLLGLDPRESLFAPEAGEERPSAGGPLRAWLRPQGETVRGALRRTAVAQPVLFALELALARLLQSWGLAPQALLGFSLGEYTAACLAGVFSLEDALRVVARRAALIEELPAGAMLAVPLPAAEARKRLGAELSLAVDAGSRYSVVAGPEAAVAELEESLAAEGHVCRRLPNAHAFHSAQMRAAAEPFTALLREVRLAPPRLPWPSNVTGTWITPDQATDPQYWVTHMCETVRFADGVGELWREPAMVLLEVGPGQGLSTLARQLAEDPAGRLALPAMRHAHDTTSDLEHLLGAVARLWLAGVALDWRAFHGGSRRALRLPSYPFERQSFWLEPVDEPAPAPPAHALTRLVFRRPGDDGSGEADGAAVPAEVVATLRRLLADRRLDRLIITAEDLATEGHVEAEPVAERRVPLRYRRPDLATPFVPPAGETERTIAGLVGELLGIEEVGAHDNFFELGGDSILAIQVTNRAAQVGLRLTPQQLFAHPTVAGLAAVAEILAGAPGPGADLVTGPALLDHYPATPLQQGMLFHTLEAPGSGVYVIQVSLALGRDLDSAAFERAWVRVVQRHRALRTSFAWSGVETPLQVVHPEVALAWDRRDWRGLPAAGVQQKWEAFLAEDRRRGFDLSTAPLMRLALASLEDGSFRFLWTYHHALLDGWALALLLRELFVVYAAEVEERAADLEPVVPFERYIAWLMEQDADAAELFWREALLGFRAPTPLTESAAGTGAGGYSHAVTPLPPAGTEELRRFARSHHLTLNSLVQGAWALLLGHYSGTGDVLFGAVTAGRSAPVRDIEKIVGLFINTLPMRAEVVPRSDLTAWLRSLQEWQVASRQFEHVSLSRIQGWSEVPRGRALFDSLLVFENIPVDDALRHQAGAWLGIGEAEVLEQTNYPLTLVAVPGDSLLLKLSFDGRYFTTSTVVRMLGSLENLLTALPASAGRVLGDLPLLAEPERHVLLAEWNDTVRAELPGGVLHRLCEEQAGRTPDAVAVVFEEEHVTYAELEARSNRLARWLRKCGVAPEVPVGVCMERSSELVVALFGILKAGGAYVPFDPAYPPERLAFLGQDSGCRLVLTQQRLLDALAPGGAEIFALDAGWGEIAQEDGAPLDAGVTPQNAAYIIYTSGSTGRPKGAVNTHGAICNRLLWMQEAFGLDGSDAILQKTPFSFDVSVWEFFWPLMTGARLVMARPGGHQDGAYLVETIRQQEITTLHFVPSMLHAFVEQPGLETCAFLRRVICSGEALGADLCRRLQARLEVPLFNLYGPTEAAIDVTAERWDPCTAIATAPIGRPIANTRVYVLDAESRPVPLGTAGHLHLGGIQLARCYLRRPELTAERFVPDPWSAAGGERLYRTGDLVRWMPDGRLEFLGRIDFQVKIRGFRIELGEIEAALGRHPAVRESVVTVREDAPGDRRLVAYLVPRGEERPDSEVMRSFLAEHLPAYMVPSAFVPLEALPLTPSGKVDRRALPAPEWAATSDYVAPRTPMEETLAEIWRELLQLDRVGIHDNFFELGGHSLLAMQLASRLSSAFGRELPVALLFANPTAHRLAKTLMSGSLAPGLVAPILWADLPPLVAVPREAGLPLTLTQQRMWILEQLQPGQVMATAGAVRIRGALHPGALIQALATLIHRHESLRTNFAAADGRPVQIIHPEPTAGLAAVDLSALPPAVREPEVRRVVRDDAVRPFDLVREPLIRVRLFLLAPSEWVLSLSLHHIVSDLWSMMFVFLPELGALHEAFVEGRPLALPPLPLQCADVAVWEQGWLRGEVLAEHLRYWRERLMEVPALLPRLADTPEGEASRTGRLELVLPPALVERLAAVGAGEGVTRFMIFLAAFDIVLARAASTERVAVVTNIAGRNHPEAQRLIGGFARQIALATDLSGDPTLREVLRRARGTVLEAHAYQALSLQDIIERLGEDARLDHLADIELTVDPPGPAALDLPGMQMDLLPQMVEQSESGLSLQIASGAGDLWAVFGYDASRFQADTIARLAEQLQAVLRALAEAPERTLGQLLGQLAAADAGTWSSRETELVEASLGRLRQLRRQKAS